MRTIYYNFWHCNYMVLCQIMHSKFFPHGESCVAGNISMDLLGSYLWYWQIHSFGSAYAWLEQSLHKHNFERNAFFYKLFLCVICTPMANKASPPPRSGAAVVQELGGVYDWRSWSRKASDQVLCHSSVACNSFCPTLHRTMKEQARGWAGEWVTEWSRCRGRWQVLLARDGGDLSAVPGHALGYRGERRGVSPSLKTLRIVLFSSFAFMTSALKTTHWNHLKYLFKGTSNVFKACCYFCSGQNYSASLSWTSKWLQLSPNHILWQITAFPIYKYSCAKLWWKHCVW